MEGIAEFKIVGSPANRLEHVYEALGLAAAGQDEVITETFGLDDVRATNRRVVDGNVRFRAAIKP
jgi:D-arabinose 1-dehydrogenase-like Zn-dependent alcohol dehydrogenase